MGPIITILLIAAVLVGAWRLGGHHTRKVNYTLREQNNLLQRFSSYWSGEATHKNELSKSIAHEQTHNLQTTLQTVITLLSSISKEKEGTMKQEDREKISSIISTIKGISPES